MYNQTDIGSEIVRYCSLCGEETAQHIHATNLVDMLCFECLNCGGKDEELI